MSEGGWGVGGGGRLDAHRDEEHEREDDWQGGRSILIQSVAPRDQLCQVTCGHSNLQEQTQHC